MAYQIMLFFLFTIAFDSYAGKNKDSNMFALSYFKMALPLYITFS